MTDMTDHLAKTRAQLDACARRGQWAQVAKIGGFKSEEAARAAFPNMRVLPQSAFVPKARDGNVSEKVFSNQQGTMVTPAPREWVLKCRGRIAAMGLKMGDVSRSMGFNKSYLPNRLSVTGHCSSEAKAAIDAHLDYLETQVKSS